QGFHMLHPRELVPRLDPFHDVQGDDIHFGDFLTFGPSVDRVTQGTVAYTIRRTGASERQAVASGVRIVLQARLLPLGSHLRHQALRRDERVAVYRPPAHRGRLDTLGAPLDPAIEVVLGDAEHRATLKAWGRPFHQPPARLLGEQQPAAGQEVGHGDDTG